MNTIVRSESIVVIGYSGHSYVVLDIFERMGRSFTGYCDVMEKSVNPYELDYLGPETEPKAMKIIRERQCFIAIGDNAIRRRVFETLEKLTCLDVSAIDPSAQISRTAKLGRNVMCSSLTVVNAISVIGDGVILNSGCIVEHECTIGRFSHIAPGAVLLGGVSVGDSAFIGANAVVRQGLTIGTGAVVGAGAVVIEEVSPGSVVVGIPARPLEARGRST